jgi:hypothetical protein
MVVRNASSIDRLIGGQLSDDAVVDTALSRQAVSLYEVALAVRRELRDEATACGCTIEVDETLPERELDPVGVELALRTLVSEALGVAAEGSRVRIGFDGTAKATACVLVTVEGGSLPEGETPLDPSLLAEVARWSGGGRAKGTRMRAQLEFPAVATETPEVPPASSASLTPEMPVLADRPAGMAASSSRPSHDDASRPQP